MYYIFDLQQTMLSMNSFRDSKTSNFLTRLGKSYQSTTDNHPRTNVIPFYILTPNWEQNPHHSNNTWGFRTSFFLRHRFWFILIQTRNVSWVKSKVKRVTLRSPPKSLLVFRRGLKSFSQEWNNESGTGTTKGFSCTIRIKRATFPKTAFIQWYITTFAKNNTTQHR